MCFVGGRGRFCDLASRGCWLLTSNRSRDKTAGCAEEGVRLGFEGLFSFIRLQCSPAVSSLLALCLPRAPRSRPVAARSRCLSPSRRNITRLTDGYSVRRRRVRSGGLDILPTPLLHPLDVVGAVIGVFIALPTCRGCARPQF